MQSARAKAAQRSLSSVLSHIKAANAKLDANCASKLSLSDLGEAEIALQPVFDLCEKGLVSRKLMKLDEAMVYMREAGLCELLVSLLRRWPWAETQQGLLPVKHLALLPGLLSTLYASLHVAIRVDRSQEAAAYAEMNKRCLLEARFCTLSCPDTLHSQELACAPALCCACNHLALLMYSRYADMRVYEAMTDTAARLVEVAREALPEFSVAAAIGNCLRILQLARHPSHVAYISPRLSNLVW